MTGKVQYKPRSWQEYNKSLIQRGNLFLWISDEALDHWQAPQSNQPGAPRQYSDLAIKTILQLKYLFNLSLRATQGFVQSLFELSKIDLPVPNYTTLSRRLRQLDVQLKLPEQKNPISLAIDSSGLKVYGEGEWKVKIHGHSKNRTWRKFHLGVDVAKQVIHAVTVTTNDFKDNEVFDDTISQVNVPITDVLGDGAYDSKDCYKVCATKKINPLFPPRKGAVLHQHGNCKKEPLPRDQAIRHIRKFGKRDWKKKVGYHRRSLAETAMFRFKKQFTPELKSRDFTNQANEIFIKCGILNQFATLGLANSAPCKR